VILAKAAAVLKKDAISALRYRNGLLLAAVAPAAQLLTFYYLARAVGPQFRPDGLPYFTFLLVGTGFYTFLLAGMHSFLRAVQESQQTGTLEVLMTTATPAPTLLLLTAVSSFAAGFVQLLFFVGAGLAFFAPALDVSATGAIVVFVLSVAIAISFGVIAAGLQVWTQKGSAVLWLFSSTAWVMAGTLFPVGALPTPVRVLSEWLPLTHALTAMRLAVLQSNSPLLLRESGILFLFALALLPASLLFFSWTVRRARQFGTLSFY
jgi:ABC-type polysaccharide/polyol phosphate export permease